MTPDQLRAPWTSEQVDALNRFQTEGGMHPFTCGRDHETHRTLDATHAGWICPAPACDYTQDWAHPFMAQPDSWPKPLQLAVQRSPEPTLRDRAIDAAKQALNTKGLWLTPDCRDSVVDAILAVVSLEACCVCGGGPVTYRNYREQPFCWPCADCQCDQEPCIRTGVSDPAVSAKARKDAAASRESERQLQQQIDRQAKEIDRLRDDLNAERALSADLRARLKATSDACSDADTALYQLRKGEEEPASPRLSGPTPAEWLWSWNRATPEQRLEWAAQIIDAGQRAGTCFQMAHEKTIQRLRADQAAVARVQVALAEFDGRGVLGDPRCWPLPTAGDALAAVHAALEPPKETPDA